MLKERLEAVTGERFSALEGIGEDVRREHEAGREAATDGKEHERVRPEDSAIGRVDAERGRDEKAARERSAPSMPDRNAGREAPQRKAPVPEPPAKTKGREMDLGL